MRVNVNSVEPYWSWGGRPELPRFPGGTVHADLAVIGGGFAGLSAAYHLLARRPGAKVVVLEAAHLGAGASGRTTGMLSPGVGQSLSALVARLGPEKARELYAETLRSVSEVAALIERERIDCELAMTGQLVVARSAGGRRRLAAQAQLLRALSLPGEALDEDELKKTIRLRPLRASATEKSLEKRTEKSQADSGPAALRFPNAGILHPLKLTAGLGRCVRARGGVIYEQARVRKLIKPTATEPAVRLCLDGGEVRAERAVVATAGYTPQLGLLRGRLLPVQLQALVTEPLDAQTLAAIGWAGREGVLDARRLFSYFRLTADRRILFGGERPRYLWGGAATDDAQSALARLGAELARTFPAGERIQIAGGWSGVIGYVLDALPSIAALPDCPQVVQAVGWCGHGVALATASGAWVAHILCDGAAPRELPWFRATLPAVPTELARWIGFRASVEWMSLMDRLQ